MTEPLKSKPQMSQDFTTISDIYDGIGVTDPYPLYAQLSQETPVMEGDILARFGVPSQADYANKGRQVFTVFRNEDVVAALRDQETWSTNLLADGFGAFFGDIMLTTLHGDQHRRLRNLLQGCFAPQVLKRWNDELVVPLVRNELMAKLQPLGKADLVRDFALQFPVRIIYLMLGFPNSPELIERFAGWALRVLGGPQRDPEKAKQSMANAFKAFDELYNATLPIVAERRAAGAVGNDLIAHLLRANYEGQTLNDDQITNLVRMLLPAAAETTTRTFCNLMVLLFQNPETLKRVREDRSLIRNAINEAMRCEPVTGFLAREATRDVVLRGATIPKGASVSLCIAQANRDPDIYPDPNRFDIDRPPRSVLGFGFGVHMCVGMPIARMELEAALDAILDLPNLRLDPDYPAPEIRGMQLRGPDSLHVRWDV